MSDLKHLSGDELREFCLGLVSDAQAERIARHLVDCRACADEAARLSLGDDPFVAKLRGLESGEAADASPQDCDLSTRIGPALTDVVAAENPSEPAAAAFPDRIGRYEIRSQLGRGGFGAVYRALDPWLQIDVAIKLPHAEVVERAGGEQQFFEEARAMIRLRHPGIVSIHNLDRTEDGRCYLVTEFVEGETLSDSLRSRGRDLPHVAAERMAAVADALQHAHQCGFVHRDLKPSNILLDREGRPRVADFGLAIHEDAQPARRGEVAGTVAYMSPEQLRGEAHLLDGRTDLWSLGVILYESLTGRRPFVGASLTELVDQILYRPVRPPRQWDERIPERLEQIVLKCLCKEVAGRYAAARDLERELRACLAPAPSGGPAARLACHLARFAGSVEPMMFINVTNLSQSDVLVITHVWIETPGQLHVANERRPLPRRLEPQETWETWISALRLPRDIDELSLLGLARARLSNGTVLHSQANLDVPARGIVPG